VVGVNFRATVSRITGGRPRAPVTFFLLAQKEKSPKKKGAPARRRKPGQTWCLGLFRIFGPLRFSPGPAVE